MKRYTGWVNTHPDTDTATDTYADTDTATYADIYMYSSYSYCWGATWAA